MPNGLTRDWADRQKTLHSFELFARYVAPRFQGTLAWTDRSAKWTSDNKERLMTGAKTVATGAGFIPTGGTRAEGAGAPSAPDGDGDGVKEAVEEGAPGVDN